MAVYRLPRWPDAQAFYLWIGRKHPVSFASFYLPKPEKAWLSVIPAEKGWELFSCHCHATQESCWGQKLDQTREWWVETIHVLSVIVKLTVLNNKILKVSTEEECPKTFLELSWCWWFQKITWMLLDFQGALCMQASSPANERGLNC